MKVQSDEAHLLARTDGLDVGRTKDSSIESSLVGGEGFVTRFEGDGVAPDARLARPPGAIESEGGRARPLARDRGRAASVV